FTLDEEPRIHKASHQAFHGPANSNIVREPENHCADGDRAPRSHEGDGAGAEDHSTHDFLVDRRIDARRKELRPRRRLRASYAEAQDVPEEYDDESEKAKRGADPEPKEPPLFGGPPESQRAGHAGHARSQKTQVKARRQYQGHVDATARIEL